MEGRRSSPRFSSGRFLPSTSRSYDVSGDGRFLMLKPVAGSESAPAPTSLVVIQNFHEELKRLVPIKN